jgi:hypothetical protein
MRWWVVVCVLTLLAGTEARRKDGRPINPFTGVPQQQVKRQPGDDRPERVQLSQRATLLPENATDMSHPDVQSRLRCNACLVASAEIASAVRDYWSAPPRLCLPSSAPASNTRDAAGVRR